VHCRLCSWVKSLTRSKAVNDQFTYLLSYVDIHRRNDRYNKMRPSKHMSTQVILKRAKENQKEIILRSRDRQTDRDGGGGGWGADKSYWISLSVMLTNGQTQTHTDTQTRTYRRTDIQTVS